MSRIMTTPAEARNAALIEAANAASEAAWKHSGDDTYSQGMDAGARHQVKACVEAIRALISSATEVDGAPVAPELKELGNQTIYYLKSIERQLRQIAEEQTGVSLGGEVLWDNLNWLGIHIEYLEKEAKS